MTRRWWRGPWRGWGLGLLTVALLVVAATAWGFVESRAAETWARVERRDLVVEVDLEGELKSVESTELGPPAISSAWNFKISRMVPEGTEVEAGQPVLGFDTTQLRQQLQEKIAERDAAEKELEKKTTDFEISGRDLELQLAEAQAAQRKADLKLAVPTEVARRNELEQAKIDHRLARLRIDFLEQNLQHLAAQRDADLEALGKRRDRAAAQVEEIQAHIEAMSVRAPRAGTVIYTRNWRGEKMKVGDSTWRGGKVLEIPDLERMRAEAQVAEADAGRLAVGQNVLFRLDAYPDAQYRGVVAKIRRAVQRKSRSNPEKVVHLEIEIPETDTERMRPGMRIRGTAEIERVREALTVPSAAVFLEPAGTAVYRRTWSGHRRLTPQFGKRSATHFEITSGLAEGDWILRRGRTSG